MIENGSSDPVAKAALAVYGYTDEKLMAGRTLYNDAFNLQAAQKKEYGEQIEATLALNEIWGKAHQQYIKTLKIARVALADHARADKAAMLYGRRKISISGWLEQAKIFYKNIMEDTNLMDAFAEFGYLRSKLQEEAALMDQVEAKSQAQKKEIGDAQEATQARDKKIDELAKWISDLRAVVKVALADNPQQLEKLGILARTSKASASQKPAEESPSTETK
jgi:hypothetical protein